ncbi:MAG: hypothetical protein M5R38_02915 [Candidatus Methylomirabilis sp.]|nr:hypothetical protein [Candidatus Methylomirabilis sp.]
MRHRIPPERAGNPDSESGAIRRLSKFSTQADESAVLEEAAVSGSQRWATILCRFADSTGITPHPKTWFETLMLGGTYPGMEHYWQELSYGQINLGGSLVVGWYNLPQPRSYYIYDRDGNGSVELDHGEGGSRLHHGRQRRPLLPRSHWG